VAYADLDQPRYLLVASMPAKARDSVQQHIAEDPRVRSRGDEIFEAQLRASPPKGGGRTFSPAQRQKARGLAWKRLAWELGLWQPPDVFPPHNGRDAIDLEAAVRPRRRSRALTGAQRAAIERRAVDVARQHLEREGWSVEDVGAVRSYDLHCTDDAGHTLWVEVKGTTGPLGSIVLTANEVEVARRQHPRTALFVIHNITLADDPKRPKATGGAIAEIRPWLPEADRLEAKVYAYRLE